MSVATVSGLAAKEVIVSTMGVLYSLGKDVDENDESLRETIIKNMNMAQAMAFVVFVMIYLPCLAATVVFSREAEEPRYTVYLVLLPLLQHGYSHLSLIELYSFLPNTKEGLKPSFL